LNSFAAESLLIGGSRRFGTSGATVTVKTGDITVDNAGTPLTGTDIILAARETITMAPNSAISSSGDADSLDTLLIGDSAIAGSGNGSLVRVSANSSAPVIRSGTGNSTAAGLTVGSGSSLIGDSLTLDSSFATNLDPSATLIGTTIALNSGQISIQLGTGPINPTSGLVLSGQSLQTAQQSAKNLSLLSYTTLDIYGEGSIGSQDLENLTLQAGSIRGFDTGTGTVAFSAQKLLIQNLTNAPFTALPAGGSAGRLLFDASEITLGTNVVHTERFASVDLNADSRILTTGIGSFVASGDLNIVTPLLTGDGASQSSLVSGGLLKFTRPSNATPGLTGGLGADLTLEGATVELNSDVLLPSGELTVRATTGSLQIGNTDLARLDVRGTSRAFLDVTRYTDGGLVNLISENGNVSLGSNPTINVSAPAGGGNAGTLNIRSPKGTFTPPGPLSLAVLGSAGTGRRTASFNLDTSSVSGSDLAATDALLNAGGFNESRQYRVRAGDLAIGGTALSSNYRVSVDQGSLTVNGTIDASGRTGGTIDLAAHGSLTLAATSFLDASAEVFSAAGKGGSVTLSAGTSLNGSDRSGGKSLSLLPSSGADPGSRIDLSVAANTASSPAAGKFTGTLHLRAPQNTTSTVVPAYTDIQMDAIGSNITGASSILSRRLSPLRPYRERFPQHLGSRQPFDQWERLHRVSGKCQCKLHRDDGSAHLRCNLHWISSWHLEPKLSIRTETSF